MRTLWYGAVTNILYVFPLFYFTSVGSASVLGIVYFVISAGTVVATPMSAGLRRLVPQERYEELCIVCASLTSVLMLLPGMYMAGTLLTSAFVTMGNTESFRSYLSDQKIAREERRLVRAKFSSLGSVIEQLQLLLVVILCSSRLTGNAGSGIAGYALREVGAWNEPVYRQTLFACVALNGLAGLLILAQGRIAESRRTQADQSPADASAVPDRSA